MREGELSREKRRPLVGVGRTLDQAPGRVWTLLWAMLDGERTVEELAEKTGLTQCAASHQLRLLRQARLVKVRRDGRHAFCRHHDHHIPDLMAALRHHHEHVDDAIDPQAASAAMAEPSSENRLD